MYVVIDLVISKPPGKKGIFGVCWISKSFIGAVTLHTAEIVLKRRSF